MGHSDLLKVAQKQRQDMLRLMPSSELSHLDELRVTAVVYDSMPKKRHFKNLF